ncbi:MAG TPA: Hint domain-containing protein [Fibrobacteraceae bacterium]|nr:Hint domain-containing protein [Fibrobacteraceae bacterium]
MSKNAVLSKEELNDLHHVLSLSEKGKSHTLDFSDPAQFRFYQKLIQGSGMTPSNYPRFFKMLEESREAHLQSKGAVNSSTNAAGDSDELVDVNNITSAEYNSSVNMKAISNASAISSVNGGTVYTQLNLQIVNLDTGEVLASTQQPAVYGQGEYQTIYTQGDPLTGTHNIQVIYTYSYQKYNQTPVFQNIHLDLNDEPQGIPNVSQPLLAQTHQNVKYMKFGLGRPSAPADCDYYWNESITSNPIVRLPFVGSQKFKSNIVSTITANDITCYMMLVQSGGGATPITPTSDLLQGIQISASDPTTLTWNFPYNNDINQDKSIQFGSATFNPDSQTIIFFQVQVKTQNSDPDYVRTCVYGVAPTSAVPNPPWSPSTNDQPGLYMMRPFLYTWHCVAADTLVEMADGSVTRIDELKGGDLVRTGKKGEALKVTHTIFADKDGTILVLRDTHGHELQITEKHAVVSKEGIRIAEELKAGDLIATADGFAEIESIEAKPFQGRVWTIGLESADPQDKEDLKDDKRAFVANGFLVCDSQASFNRHVEHKQLLSTILAKIPEDWHQDAQNSHRFYHATKV